MAEPREDMSNEMLAARREMRRTLLRLDIPANQKTDLLDKYYRALTLSEHEAARISISGYAELAEAIGIKK